MRRFRDLPLKVQCDYAPVERIAQMSEENGAAVKETAHASQSLETLASSLHNSVTRFKIQTAPMTPGSEP